MYVGMDSHLIRHLISTKINIGRIHLLNNGVICRMEDSDLINECGPCTFSKYKIINPDKGVECIHNLYKESLYYHIVDENLMSCYKYIMPDSRLRVAMRIGKCSLFTISRFKRYNDK